MFTRSAAPNQSKSASRSAAQENQIARTSSALVQENASKSNAIQIPAISLPKGGGALRGIDEKFQVNTANGTAGFGIPLPLTPGRNGFSPSLSLNYNSGAGNSPYGLGWSVDYPIIQRKTDKRLPRYREGLDEDIFMFSGAEDLVPLLEEQRDGTWQGSAVERGEYRVKSYRPRIEGAFDRIEKITHPRNGTYWKVTTKNNVATIFGRNANSRIADPENQSRPSHWLPEFSYDDKGNWIEYEYKEEDLENVPNELYESNRLKRTARFTNKYLKKIRYGNRRPYDATIGRPEDPPVLSDTEHFFSIVWDYGEHDLERPTPAAEPGQKWNYRPDAFSSYRTGFEIRTNRLCRRILVFHHFEELGTEPYLVRSVDFQYAPSSVNQSGQTEVTYLKSITQSGYIRKADGSYSKKSLPPMEFSYQQLDWNEEIKLVDAESIVHAPAGLTNNYQWFDLYSEGVSGILTEQAEGWYYKGNLGDRDQDGQIHFTQAQKVIPKPSFVGMTTGVLSLQDLEANGQKQVVVNRPGLHGFFELTTETEWKPFRSFLSVSHIDLQDPNTRLIDLNGDGQAELVVTEEHAFVWYGAKGKDGYAAAEWATKTFDEERGPAIVFADSQQTIFLADMTGDGLTDIVRIRNGEICYWANKGYGCFSAKVTMSNSPWFDHPDLFNPAYLHLADVSGTGATDVIYTGKKAFRAFLNLSGNAWGDAHVIEPFPLIDNNSKISVVDLLGRGTSCIVWSSDAPSARLAPMRYIDLMGGKKPHVLSKYVNNLGKETHIEYKSSSHFYLKDKRENRPWITKLPFPVQVVSKLIVEERVTDVRFSTEYSYHHGYYDHAEREFRGFGMVEQIDTEIYETWSKNNAGNRLESSEELYQKPVLTKTWFHTGAFLERERILTHFRAEYWHAQMSTNGFALTVDEPELTDARLVALPSIHDSAIVDKLTTEEWREALRACKGRVLRQEVFALDAPAVGATEEQIRKQMTPFTVATHNCQIQLLQPREENKHAIFLVTEREAITFHYERNTEDPRVAHTLNVRIDDLGNVLEAASIVYPRRRVDASLLPEVQAEQHKTLITYTRNVFTNDVLLPTTYRLRLPAETQTFEITNLIKPDGRPLYLPEDFRNILDRAAEIAYESNATTGATQRRLIEHLQTLYYNDDLTSALALGRLDPPGLQFESFQLAFTPSLLRDIFADKLPASAAELENLLGDNDSDTEQSQCKFVQRADANWWIRSGTIQYLREGENREHAKHRFVSPLSYTDPFGSTTRVNYHGDYFLLMESVEDELQNRVKVEQFNFRTLAPQRIRDPNDNLSAVLFDELGLVKATALEGKDLDGDGVVELEIADSLQGLQESTAGELSDIAVFFASEDSEELVTIGRNLLQHASSRFVYDFDRYRRSQSARAAEPNECARTRLNPSVAAAIAREEHDSRNPASRLQIQFEYSDGLGKVALTKTQAEPGLAKRLEVQADCSFTVQEVDTARPESRLRWIGNGRTVLNNKAKPVKQYQPYFSVTPHYEDAKELVETGVTPILFYDSLGRLIKTEFPDQTFSRVEFDAWKQASYDQNDTVRNSAWYDKRINRRIDAELIAAGKDPIKERTAAEQAAAHHGTPSLVHLDTLGRPILSVEHNRLAGRDEFYRTRVVVDIEGNVRNVVDARDNTAMRYKYDMLGHRVYTNSMDAGERWLLNNVVGKPVRSWDSRGHSVSVSYDQLQRPTRTFVRESGGEEKLVERTVFGEPVAVGIVANSEAKRLNLRGKMKEHYDGAGVMTNEEFDFKGNLLRHTRRFAVEYRSQLNWSASPLLQAESFTISTTFDALNRPVAETMPDRSVIRPTFNEANLLDRVGINLRGTSAETLFVGNIEYDAKRRRQKIVYGNNTQIEYGYDSVTFRLIHLTTTRTSDGRRLQDLSYTYDPVGNITAIRDNAQQTIYFRNSVVEPSAEYEYDALYRLISASGREHLGQNASGRLNPPVQTNQDDSFRTNLPQPSDGSAMGNYTESYEYDAVGNILRMIHQAGAAGSWTRHYAYAADSNRLLHTSLPGDRSEGPYSAHYTYDAHGNMTSMPHLPAMESDYKDQLRSVRQQVVSEGGSGETAYYVYDASGQRVRKVIERAGGSVRSERLYLGEFEVYRERSNGNVTLERETLHVMDGQRRIALVETKTIDSSVRPFVATTLIRYQLDNHLGSASVEVDGAGEIISYEEYYPYGTTSYRAVRSGVEVSPKRYRYTGKERDEESGLYYHGARYYAPWLGRWTSCDPKGISDGANVYVFVHNNPTNKIDRKGTNGEPWWRFTEAGYYYQAGEHDIHQPHPGVDTGFAPANLAVNLLISTANLVGMAGNVVTRTFAAPEMLMRAAGASDTDIHAYRFVSTFAGVGEVNAALRVAVTLRGEVSAARVAVQEARAATQEARAVQAASQVTRAVSQEARSTQSVVQQAAPIIQEAWEMAWEAGRVPLGISNQVRSAAGTAYSYSSGGRCTSYAMVSALRNAGYPGAVVTDNPASIARMMRSIRQPLHRGGTGPQRGTFEALRAFALRRRPGTQILIGAEHVTSAAEHSLIGVVGEGGTFQVMDAAYHTRNREGIVSNIMRAIGLRVPREYREFVVRRPNLNEFGNFRWRVLPRAFNVQSMF